MSERRSEAARPKRDGKGTITLPFQPTDDTEITCVYCKATHCAFELIIKHYGTKSFAGLCAACRAAYHDVPRMAEAPLDRDTDLHPADCDCNACAAYEAGYAKGFGALGRNDAQTCTREDCTDLREQLRMAKTLLQRDRPDATQECDCGVSAWSPLCPLHGRERAKP